MKDSIPELFSHHQKTFVHLFSATALCLKSTNCSVTRALSQVKYNPQIPQTYFKTYKNSTKLSFLKKSATSALLPSCYILSPHQLKNKKYWLAERLLSIPCQFPLPGTVILPNTMVNLGFVFPRPTEIRMSNLTIPFISKTKVGIKETDNRLIWDSEFCIITLHV